jgi:hypothetical protein
MGAFGEGSTRLLLQHLCHELDGDHFSADSALLDALLRLHHGLEDDVGREHIGDDPADALNLHPVALERFRRSRGRRVYIDSGDGIYVYDSTLRGNDYGVFSEDAYEVRVYNSLITGTGRTKLPRGVNAGTRVYRQPASQAGAVPSDRPCRTRDRGSAGE